MINKKILLVGFLTSAAALVPTAVSAQGTSGQTAQQIATADQARSNTIIVTARGREENIQDVPLAITAFDARALEDRSIQDLEDVARFTAGFSITGISGGLTSPTIRGQSLQRIQNLEQPVGTFINGVYLPRSWMTDLGTADLDRIEVVKGPQSVRYGRNTFAGAINYVSPSADLDEITGRINGTFGSDKRKDAGAAISFPIVEGVLAFRASFDHSESDGTWTNLHPNVGLITGPSTEGNVGGWNKDSYSANLVFEPVDGVRIEGRYIGFERYDEAQANYWLNSDLGDGNCGTQFNYGGAFPVVAPGGGRLFCGTFGVEADTVEVDPRAYGRNVQADVYSINADFDITDALSLTYQFGIAKGRIDGRFTTEADQVNCGGLLNANGPVPFFGTVCNFQGSPTGDVDYDQHELRLTYNAGGAFSGGIGAFYSEGEDRRFSISQNLAPLGRTSTLSDPTNSVNPTNNVFGRELNETDALGLFGEASFAFPNEATRFTAELRYTREELQTTNLATMDVFNETFEFITPRFTLEHDVSADALLFATVARGAKAGGFNPRAFNVENRVFDPEFNWTYEVGAKATVLDGRGNFNLAAFLTKWDDLQTTAADPGNPALLASTVTLNLGDATIYGVELEGNLEPIDGLTFDGAISYTVPTFDDGVIDQSYILTRFGVPASCDGITCPANGEISGNDLPRAPRFQASLGAGWTGDINANGDEYFLRADLSYQSDFFSDPMNLAEVSSRFLVNARGGFEFNDLRISLWARNLFDKKYVSSAQLLLQNGAPNFLGNFYGERRTVGVSAGFNF